MQKAYKQRLVTLLIILSIFVPLVNCAVIFFLLGRRSAQKKAEAAISVAEILEDNDSEIDNEILEI